MKTKTIYHLDHDCNVTFVEVRHYLENKSLHKIEVIDSDGTVSSFLNYPKLLKDKKAIKRENENFVLYTKEQVRKLRIRNRDMSTKVLKSLIKEVENQPIITEEMLNGLISALSNFIKKINPPYMDCVLTGDLQTPLIQKEPLQYAPAKKVSRADYIGRCFALLRFDNNLPEGWTTRPYSAPENTSHLIDIWEKRIQSILPMRCNCSSIKKDNSSQ